MSAFLLQRPRNKAATRVPTDEAALVYTSRGLIDSIRMPLFLIHPNRALVHANPLGVKMLGRSDCIYRFKGALACIDAESQQALEKELRRVGADGTMRTITPMRATNGSPVAATVTCLWQGHVLSARHRTDLLLMAITDQSVFAPNPGEIATAFHLTPAEARIAGAIGIGKTPQECAHMMQVKVSTIRTHLISIYRKTSTGSQVHLARLIQALSLF
jgi:DNA-binding CsgD family transcriptional regulator